MRRGSGSLGRARSALEDEWRLTRSLARSAPFFALPGMYQIYIALGPVDRPMITVMLAILCFCSTCEGERKERAPRRPCLASTPTSSGCREEEAAAVLYESTWDLCYSDLVTFHYRFKSCIAQLRKIRGFFFFLDQQQHKAPCTDSFEKRVSFLPTIEICRNSPSLAYTWHCLQASGGR